MAYIGKAPPTTGKDAGASFDIDDVSSNFNGSTTAFAIEVGGESLTPTSTNVFIFLGGVLQHPGDAYTISGSNIAFTAAPESGTSFQGTVLGHTRTITPDQGTVGDTSFASSAGTAITGSFTEVSSSISTRITSNDDDMTLATASIAANETNMTLATASIAAITASLGQPVNTDSNVQFADITSTGTITAVEVHTTFVSSSIAVISGSNNFGDDTSDHHSFTGSVSVSSSLSVTGSTSIDGALTTTGALTTDGDITSTGFYVTASGQSVIQVGNTGNNLSKWEFHRDGFRKWVIYNDGRTSPSTYQDALIFKRGVSSDSDATHINMALSPFDQGIKFFGHITASANISSSGNVSVTGNLDIDGTSNLEGDVTLQGNVSSSITSTGSFGTLFAQDTVGIGTDSTSGSAILQIKQANDGGTTSVHIDNTAANGSSDELVSLEFKHAGGQPGGKIVSDRTGVYNTPGQTQAAMHFYSTNDAVDNLAMTITKEKKIGIGTDAPDGNIHIHSATAGSVTAHGSGDELILEHDDHMGMSFLTPNDGRAHIYFGDVADNNAGQIVYDHTADYLSFSTAGAERMVISGSGAVTFHKHIAVGAETRVPLWEDTSNEWGAVQLGNAASVFGAGSGTTNSQAYLATNTYYNGGWKRIGAGEASYINLNDDGHIFFASARDSDGGSGVDSAITFTTHMAIKNDGKVGIGGTSPTSPLHVVSSSASRIVRFQNLGDDAAYGGINVSAGKNDQSGTTVYLECDDGDGQGAGVIENASGTFQLRDTSDIRLKNNIRDTAITGSNIINSIKVRDFEWKKSGTGVTAGLVAQELTSSFAQAVSSGSADKVLGYSVLGISKERLVPVLVKALQESMERIETLEAQMAQVSGSS